MKKIIGTLVLASMSIPTFAQSLEGPMLYKDLNPQLDSNGHKLYQGIKMIGQGNDLKITNTNTVFYEPKMAEVVASEKTVSIAANCSAVKNLVRSEEISMGVIAAINESLKELREERDELRGEKRVAKKVCRSAGISSKDCDEAIGIQEEVDDLSEEINYLRADIKEVSTDYRGSDVDNTLQNYSKQFGGKLLAVVSNNGEEQQEELEGLNPGFNFKPIPVKNVRFHLATDASDYSAEITRRTVLDVAPVNVANPEATDRIKQSEIVTGSGSMDIQIALSRLGACSDKHARVARFVYDFDAFGFVKGYGMLNRSMLYTKIAETTTSGGLFSSDTKTSLDETVKDSQVLDVYVYGDLSEEDSKLQVEQIRSHITNEALRSWTTMTALSNGQPMPMPGQGTHGAQTIADGVQKYCPHVYCQAGAMALKALDQIFGSDSARSSVRKDWDQKIKYEYKYSTKNTYSGAASTIVKW